MALRVLIVAPEVPSLNALLTADEIDAIAPSHTTDVITGTVTQARIMLRASNQHYDIIHFVAHGGQEGVALSDGLMKPEDILQLARHTRARLVFFNACLSTVPGQLLIDTGVPAAVVHNTEVLDRNALRLAGYFYAELGANGGDLRAAYHVANPRDGSLSWLSNGNYQEQSTKVILAEIETLKTSAQARDAYQARLGLWLFWLAVTVGVDVAVSLLATLWFVAR